jgi:hypothetical protein
MARGPGKKPRKWFCPGQALQSLLKPLRALAKPARLLTLCCRDNMHCETFTSKGQAAVLVERVVTGLRPMATLNLRAGKRRFLNTPALERVVDALGLGRIEARNSAGGLDMHVFQRGATLADFYDEAHAIALYRGAGFALSAEALRQPLEELAPRLYGEDFRGDTRHPLLELCWGHPLHEAVARLSPALRSR